MIHSGTTGAAVCLRNGVCGDGQRVRGLKMNEAMGRMTRMGKRPRGGGLG